MFRVSGSVPCRAPFGCSGSLVLCCDWLLWSCRFCILIGCVGSVLRLVVCVVLWCSDWLLCSLLCFDCLLCSLQVCGDGVLLGVGPGGAAQVPAAGPVFDRVPCCARRLRLTRHHAFYYSLLLQRGEQRRLWTALNLVEYMYEIVP